MNVESFSLWSLLFFFCLVAAVAVAMITASFFLGQKHEGRVTNEPYESGMPLTKTPALRVNVKYYLVAMFFVIFDAEALFLFAWALAVRELGLSGYIELLVFVLILIIALAYLWKRGALNWGAKGLQSRLAPEPEREP